ncbi:MAG: hypothetical protein KDE19_00610, partial [Caldilineaceae bacterium]|nr:hypothetical protein [Caldilineaceae bacterium]
MKVTQQSRLAILTIVLTILTLFAGVHRIQAAPLQQTDDASAATTIAQLTALAPTFQDDFATWDEAWTLGSDGGMLNHEGAAEAVTVQGLGDKVGWMTHADLDTLDLRDYLAEVTVKQEDGPSGQFMAGLLFRYVDGKNFYVFAVQQQDDQLSYALYKVEDGSEDALIAPQPIADLPGAVAKTDDTEWSVKLGLLAISDTLTLLLDDTIIDRATDATYPAGSIGIGSAVQSTEEMKLYFDDVALWTADDLAVTADDAMEADSTSTDLAALQADLTTQLATIRATEPDAYDEFRRSNEDWSGLSTALITVELADGLRNTTVEPGGTLYDFYKSLLEAAPTDFLVEVDTTFDSGNDLDQYGLVFRYQDTDNFYVFALYGDGYTLWRKMA